MSGKGTDICAKCGGAKEPTRRNSQNCRSCDSGGATPRARRFRLTLSVPESTWDALSAAVKGTGLTHYAMAQRVLNDWARTQSAADALPAPENKRAPVDPARLARAVLWMQSQGLVKPATITTKSGLMAWCEQQGFEQ